MILKLLFCCFSLVSTLQAETLRESLIKEGINWNVPDRFSNSFKGSSGIRKIGYVHGNEEISIEVLPKVEKNGFLGLKKIKNTLISQLYKPMPTPYDGITTSVISCPNELTPKIKDFEIGSVLVAKVNDRHAFGICDPKQLTQWGGMALIYDSVRRRAIQINLYFNKRNERDFNALVESINKIEFSPL